MANNRCLRPIDSLLATPTCNSNPSNPELHLRTSIGGKQCSQEHGKPSGVRDCSRCPLSWTLTSIFTQESHQNPAECFAKVCSTRYHYPWHWQGAATPYDCCESSSDLQLKELGGLQASISRIQAVVKQKSGSAEELVAIFVAILRAAGLLVRFVR